MTKTSTQGPSLLLTALLAGGALCATANDAHAAAFASALRRAPDQQLAAAGNRLRGPQIRHLLSGHTARMRRGRGNKSLGITLSFNADGTVRHSCRSQNVNVRSQGQIGSRCRTPSASGQWAVRGNKLCITMSKRRCYLVIRRGNGYVFRSPAGKGRPYAGRVSVQ
jgi:hypothetical protein